MDKAFHIIRREMAENVELGVEIKMKFENGKLREHQVHISKSSL